MPKILLKEALFMTSVQKSYIVVTKFLHQECKGSFQISMAKHLHYVKN